MAVDANIGILSPDTISLIEPIERVDWRAEMPEREDRYWRFHGFVDFWGADPVGSIYPECWRVLRHTPKGVWLAAPFTWNVERHKKLVIHSARKKWAYPTKKEAWDSYCIRLEWREKYWSQEGERIAKLKHLVAQENA